MAENKIIDSLTFGDSNYTIAIPYGTCATEAATAAKVVTCANFIALETGASINVKFTYANSVANPTLNVNSTGAKTIVRYGTTKVTSSGATGWVAGAVVTFTYDGTYWVINSSPDHYAGDITGVTAGDGLTGGGSSGSVTLNVGAGDGITVGTDTISHADTSTLEGSYGPTADVTQSAKSSASIVVPQITVDGFGHVTGVTNRTLTVTDTNTDNNTWRKVQLNGTDKLGTGTTTNPLNIKAGKDMSITESSGTFTFNSEINFESFGTHSELGSFKYTISSGTYTRSQAFKCIIGTDYYYGFLNVVKNSSGTITSYDIIMWKGAAIYYLTYTVSNSTWAENTKYLSTTDHTHSGYAASDHTHGYIEGASNGLSIDHQVGSTKKVQANLKNNTKSSYAATYNAPTSADSSRFCAVSLDSSGYLAVNVPWNSGITSHQTIKQDGITGATVNRFGTCSTAAATAAKTVSITNGTFSLETGARVTVKFTNANTASTPTLNVASKGAKNIFHKGAQITTGTNKSLLAGTVDFVYDGTQWHLVGNYIDSNTTYGGATQSAAGLMSPADKIKVDTLAAAANKGVDDSISAGSTSTNLPTSKAVAAFVEGKGYITTDNNTTYTIATGDSNGQIKVTPSTGSAYNVSVKGLGSSAFVTTYKAAECTTFTSEDGNCTPAAVKKAVGLFEPKAHAHSGLAYCTTAAATAAKTATMTGFALASGQQIFLRTTVTNSATSNVTLNVNSTGAKPVKIGNTSTAPTTSNFPAGDYIANYDGTNWILTRIYLTDNNTTYGGGAGISVSGGLISNSGVRSISTGSTNGTISVNTGGTSAEVAVKGLGSAAYTASTAYASSSHTHDYSGTYAASSHTHNYAGSSSAGGAATSANKVNSNLVVKLNSGTTEGTNLFTFNGSAAKTINITPSAIGAAASSHTHSEYAASSHGTHVTTATVKSALGTGTGTSKYLREDGTWVTPPNTTYNAMSYGYLGLGQPIAHYYQSTATIGGNAFAGSQSPIDATGVVAVDINSLSTTSGRNYGVVADKVGRLFVNVPWTNTTYTFNGAVSTIKDSNLTASRALISNSSGKVAISAVTSTELGYLDGVTSNVQTQLDNKTSVKQAGSYSDENAFKYDITSGSYNNSWVTVYLGDTSTKCLCYVEKTSSGYQVFVWKKTALCRWSYSTSNSTWTDTNTYFAESSKLPSFSLSGTVLTITDNS